jgi:hypothetical protein
VEGFSVRIHHFLALALVSLSIGCSGSDSSELGTTHPPDAGKDTGAKDGAADSKADRTSTDSGGSGGSQGQDGAADAPPHDGAADVSPGDAGGSVPDATPPVDAGPDAVITPPVDAGPDVVVTPPVDAAPDAPADAGGTIDVGVDAPADTGTPADAGSDAAQILCPDPANLANEYAKFVCQKNTTCCSGADASTCPKTVADAFLATYPDLATSAQLGSASINCDKYRECVQAMTNASCTTWPAANGYYGADPVPNVAACHEFVVSLYAAGHACTQDYQCINGFCWDTEGGDAGSPDKKCHAFVAGGGICTATLGAGAQDKLCNPTTHFCNGSNVCESRRANTAVCTLAKQCASGNCAPADAGQTCQKPGQCEYKPSPMSAGSLCALSAGRRTGAGGLWLTAALALLGARRRRHHH